MSKEQFITLRKMSLVELMEQPIEALQELGINLCCLVDLIKYQSRAAL